MTEVTGIHRLINKTFYEHETIPAKGHQLGAETEKVVTPATCTAAGQKVVEAECKVCHEVITVSTENIKATGHKDADGDGKCDKCEKVITAENPTSFFARIRDFFVKIISFFKTFFNR